jgi:hypothetical protein
MGIGSAQDNRADSFPRKEFVMPADLPSADTPDTPPKPVDAHATGNMGWVMPIWLIAFLVVVVFGIVSYLFGWWYQRSVGREKTNANPRTMVAPLTAVPFA